MRLITSAFVVSLLLPLACGCGPRLDKAELGEIEYKLPVFPEAESKAPAPEKPAQSTAPLESP